MPIGLAFTTLLTSIAGMSIPFVMDEVGRQQAKRITAEIQKAANSAKKLANELGMPHLAPQIYSDPNTLPTPEALEAYQQDIINKLQTMEKVAIDIDAEIGDKISALKAAGQSVPDIQRSGKVSVGKAINAARKISKNYDELMNVGGRTVTATEASLAKNAGMNNVYAGQTFTTALDKSKFADQLNSKLDDFSVNAAAPVPYMAAISGRQNLSETMGGAPVNVYGLSTYNPTIANLPQAVTEF